MGNNKSEKAKFDFDTVFDPDDYLYFYENMLTDEYTDKQVEFLKRELNLDKPKRILDLACGHGRHANRLAKSGHDVVGVDRSRGFLDIAGKEADEMKVNIQYVEYDMRKIEYENEFDRVILMFTAFGFFEESENYKVLENIYRALKPGGIFCFDTLHRDVLLKNFLPYIANEKNDDFLIDRNSFDPYTGRLECRRIIFRNGVRKDARFFIRLYNLTEIKLLLHQAGFDFVNAFSTTESEPLTMKSHRMYVLAKK